MVNIQKIGKSQYITTIPITIIKMLGLKDKDQLEFKLVHGEVCLRKV